ncbi:TonB-dependent receptor [Maricaulis sp.]|uniref:TonB-dependent receptor n=1 Tax=Maricaulis sp. TaxID=1486257 RepID=UPI003A8EB1C1
MKYFNNASALAIAVSLMTAPSALAQQEEPAASGPQLDTITITAQRRETTLQDASIAVSAMTGEQLEKDRILSFEDLAGSVTSLSFTALSPLDQEFNIRGITNTRLDSPTADQSIGIFLDDVYVGRSGLFNADLYDIARVEVVRGPQGVLLGRNVVGGALNIIVAEPDFTPGGNLTVSVGNYDEVLTRGFVTGPLTDEIAGRLSFQSRNHSGYSYDVLHDRDLDDLRSFQLRGQLLFQPDGSAFSARLVADYTKDESNGFLSVAVDGPDPATQGPWSIAREQIGALRGTPLSIREGLPEHPLFSGDANETPQGLDREAYGVAAHLEYDIEGFATLTSTTGYREGQANNLYDQTGQGPNNGYGIVSPLLFRFPLRESEDISQFTQEFRLVSNTPESPFDWIVGAYYQHDEVTKLDQFWAEVPLTVLSTLSGESHWNNSGETTSYAAFAQMGYRFNEQFRVVAGVRYTHDDKSGTVTALAVETGDAFNPTDTVPLSPLAPTFTEGGGFTTDYGDEWSQVTTQVTAEYAPSEDLFVYLTWAQGYKGGGFEDDPANAIAAQSGYDPETVENIELGVKYDFWDSRARLNVAAFQMSYQNLQVTQTDAGCLCNITDNAADADISGIEAELQFAVTDNLRIWGGATFLQTEYIDFVDSLGVDSSGNNLQRTPEHQFNIGGELTFDAGPWRDALSARLNYSYHGEMFWAPDNNFIEEAYGLLDGRLTLTPPNADWTLSVWGKNLTDELYRTNIIPFFGDEISRFATPRTYGIELSVDF